MKKKITTIIKKNAFYIALIGILLVIGGSFALFTANFIGDKYQVINLNGLKFRYTEGDSAIYMENAEPMSDEDGKKLDNYFDFNIYLEYKNDYSIPYNIFLEELDNNTVDPKYIKVYLTDQNDNVIIGPTKISDLEPYKMDDYLLHSTSISTEENNNNTQYYRLRTWLDENYVSDVSYETNGNVQTGMIGGTFGFRVNISSVNLDTSYANAPVLASNMIPVYYDGTDWVKADKANQDKNNKWYDYGNKMWANAVTVAENSYVVGKVEDNVSVNVGNSNKVVYYKNTNSGIPNSKSSSIFTFTAASSGTFSFDWSVASENNYDKFTIKINNVILTEANEVSGIKNGTYTTPITKGTSYTIEVLYSKDGSVDSNGDTATIEFNLPTGTTITNSVNSSYPNYKWSENTKAAMGWKAYDSYSIVDKKFSLLQVSVTDNVVGKYICSDGTSVSCNEMYQILEHNNEAITKVKKYSNITTVNRDYYLNATVGTKIDINSINTMLVWIPRFSATKNGSYNGGTKEKPGAFNITFVNTGTPAHDSFTFGSQNLSGFWIGKFENSSDTTCTATDYSAVGSGCNLNTIRPKVIPNATSWRGAMVSTIFYDILAMTESGNQYGFDKTINTTLDTHMLKNNEWGAVAYLTQSIYGRCTSSTSCTEIGINNDSGFRTGYGAPAGSSPGTYETTLGMDASTTGNIYGVYDMSGGARESVMGVFKSGTYLWSGLDSSHNSGFNGCLGSTCEIKSDGISFPEEQYYNAYNISDTKNVDLQHTLYETFGWYSDTAYNDGTYSFVKPAAPWLTRGGKYNDTSKAGIFTSNASIGNGFREVGSRTAIVK